MRRGLRHEPPTGGAVRRWLKSVDPRRRAAAGKRGALSARLAMAIYHLSTKPISRSSGRSAVAAAAYRSGSCLVDQRQGITHDYERRSGVEHEQLVVPEGAGSWTRQDLWNAAESAEKRKDARTAREWELALPEELSAPQRQELVIGFAQELCQRFGCAVDVGIHAPDKQGDQRNWHAHLLATTRQVTAAGLGDKCTLELSDTKRRGMGLGAARQEVEAVRQVWEQHLNQALERAGRPERVSCQTLEKQREGAERRGDHQKARELNRAPQTKLGWKVVAMERRGKQTYRGDQFRTTQQENRNRQAEVVNIDTLRAHVARQERMEGNYEKAVARLRQFPTKEGRLGMVRQWEHLAKQPIPTDARAVWEKSTMNPDAIAWRGARSSVARCLLKVRQVSKAVANWLKSHPIQARVAQSGFVTPPKLKILEDDRYAAERALADARHALERIEKRWPHIRPEMETQILRSSEAIHEARRYTEALAEFRDRFTAMLDRDEAARMENYRANQRRRDRGRELG